MKPTGLLNPAIIRIKAALVEREWTVSDLAEVLGNGMPTRQIMKQKYAFSPTFAVAVEAALGIPALDLLKGQNEYQVANLRESQDVQEKCQKIATRAASKRTGK